MSLPVPNLDDRSWKQIVDEAVRLIPRYCPEWTNHNASDPGVTLLELYAWMTEMVIYRLNKVPEKNFLAFLDLIGVRLKPPEPAKVVLELTPSEGAEGELVVHKGTQVATLQSGGADPVTFETLRDITLLPLHVVRAASSHRAAVADHTEALASGEAHEPLFTGVQEVERFLYLGDDRLNAFNEEAAVDLFFDAMPGSSGPRVPTITEWQYFDGKRWRDMTVNRAESDSRRLAFGSHPGIEKQIVNNVETYWIRGKLAEPPVVPAPEGSPDLVVTFEYWNGRKWAELGRTSPMGVSGVQGQFNFLDSSGAFTRSGAISFDRPIDMVEAEVGGQKNFWIRARINAGNYGAPGSYELIGQNWVFKEDRPLRPPCLKSLVFKYVREPRPIAHCMSFNDFQYRDHTDDLNTPYVFFQPFLPDQDETPAFYLGFDARFPQQPIHLYFELDDVAAGGAEQLGGSAPAPLEETMGQKGPRVVWEHWDGARWADLLPQDRTYGFTRSGHLTFNGPRNFEKRSVFDSEAWWLRARLETGSYDLPPVLRAVLVNAVDAINGVTVEEVLGPSDGSIDQSFTLANAPILAGPELWVLEPDAPTSADRGIILREEGPEAIEPDADGAGSWVRWHEGESFFDGQASARHYLCDPIKGEVTFGDGRKGWVPPVARDSIKCEYRLGGGVAGNVGANTLTVLKQSVAFVQNVTNPFAAQGGADPESIDEAKSRGTFAIKNRDRAITTEDYESLALAASRRVARAKCVQASDGSISLLLVPKAERGNGDARAIPSRDMIERDARHLAKS